MFIAEKKLDIPVIQVDLANKEQHSEAFAKLNPHRTVPVLVLDDGSTLNSTNGICHYLEAAYPERPLLGAGAAERGLIADLDWRIEQEGFLAVGEAFRNRARSFKNNAVTGANEHAQIPELVERGRARALQYLEWFDGHMQQREFVAGDNFSVADITAFVTLEFAKWIKLEPSDSLVNLHRWYSAVGARDSAKL